MMKNLNLFVSLLFLALLAGCGPTEDPQKPLKDYLQSVDALDARMTTLRKEVKEEHQFVDQEVLSGHFDQPAIKKELTELSRRMRELLKEVKTLEPPPTAEKHHEKLKDLCQLFIGQNEQTIVLLDAAYDLSYVDADLIAGDDRPDQHARKRVKLERKVKAQKSERVRLSKAIKKFENELEQERKSLESPSP